MGKMASTQNTIIKTQTKKRKSVKSALDLRNSIGKLNKKTTKHKMSRQTADVLNDMCIHFMDKFLNNCAMLSKRSKRKTANLSMAESACKLTFGFDSELSNQCIMEGKKALSKFKGN